MGTAIQILVALSLMIGVACASSPTISFDAGADWSRFRTWDWLSNAAPIVNAPDADYVGPNRDISHLIARALEERGFEQDHRAPDLRVDVRFNVRREQVTVLETGATEELSSFHFSPSYQVQATTKRLETYERSRLVLLATDTRRGRIVWEGTLEERFRDQFSPHLAGMVETLLERFPPAGHGANRSPPSNRSLDSPAPIRIAQPPSRSTPDVAPQDPPGLPHGGVRLPLP